MRWRDEGSQGLALWHWHMLVDDEKYEVLTHGDIDELVV
jgi:hypothetical protein